MLAWEPPHLLRLTWHPGYGPEQASEVEVSFTPVWLVLTYTPAPGVARPFEHPDFGAHPAFRQRLNERGVLVAAGPFPASGEGMTVVRVPPEEVDLLVKQVNDDDLSVVNGVLEVRVRPWLVTLTGSSLP